MNNKIHTSSNEKIAERNKFLREKTSVSIRLSNEDDMMVKELLEYDKHQKGRSAYLGRLVHLALQNEELSKKAL